MTSIPFLDILYVVTCLATIFGTITELFRKRPKDAGKVLIVGVLAAALEVVIIGFIIYHWPWDKLILRYITHGNDLIPYLIHEYF